MQPGRPAPVGTTYITRDYGVEGQSSGRAYALWLRDWKRRFDPTFPLAVLSHISGNCKCKLAFRALPRYGLFADIFCSY